MNKLYLTWEDIENQVTNLAEQISKSQENIIAIYGLPRGGLIPAVMLSHRLGLPLVSKPTKGTLIVDDICDSGETFIKLSRKYPTNYLACLHLKPHTSNFIPDIYAETFNSNDWISYPWERKDEDPIADYLK